MQQQRLGGFHGISTGPSTRGTRNRRHRSEASDHLLTAAFLTPPVALLSLLVLLIAYCLTSNEQHFNQKRLEISTGKVRNTAVLKITPSLLELTELVLDALDANDVIYWLMPGAGLLPGRRVAPWREGLDFGVNQSDVMRILTAQSELLQPYGIVAIESHFGLRLFSMSGYADDRYDFRTPFIDLMYFQLQSSQHPPHVVNHCCDCDPIVLGACTKKTCKCLVCALHIERLFPLYHGFHIEGMSRPITAPKDHEHLDMVLKPELPNSHPALFDTNL